MPILLVIMVPTLAYKLITKKTQFASPSLDSKDLGERWLNDRTLRNNETAVALADPSRALGMPPVQYLSFACRFRQKSCQIIGFQPKLRGWRPHPIWEILDQPLSWLIQQPDIWIHVLQICQKIISGNSMSIEISWNLFIWLILNWENLWIFCLFRILVICFM